MSIWRHFSFRKKKKKANKTRTLSNYPSPFPMTGRVWVASTPYKPESLGKCECCGNDIYYKIWECELCGRKTCEDCSRVITKVMHTFNIAASTILYSYPNPLPQSSPHASQGSSVKDIIICVSCADVLKLSLRIAATQGEKENGPE